MKKISLLICTLLLSILAACSSPSQPEEAVTPPQSEPITSAPVTDPAAPDSSQAAQDMIFYGEGFVIPEDKINTNPHVSLVLEKEINPESCLIRNDGDEILWFGGNHRIELKTSGGWKRIQAIAEAPAYIIMLESGKEENMWIRRDNMIDMVEGKYRVIMEFNLTETDITGNNNAGDEAYYVSSEFEIMD